MKAIIVAIIAILVVSACQQDEPAEYHFEVAINGIHGGALSGDGRHAIVGSVQHGGSFWRLQDSERLFNWNHAEGEQSVIISADIDPTGSRAITAEAHTMVLWDVKTGAPSRFWTAPGEVLDVDLTPGGYFALLGLADHSAVIFNAARGGIARAFTHQGRVRSVDLSDDGRFAITGSEDQTAVVWRVDNGQALFTAQHNEDVQQVAISPQGRYAFSSSKYDRAELWQVDNRQSLGTIPLSRERLKRGLEITAARFSPDENSLLLGYTNQTVELWQLQPLEKLKTWTLPKRHRWQPTGVAVVDLSFAGKEKNYYAMGSNGFIYLLQ